jgi:3-oxoacyl-(acyl-carrier-protein) synthase
LRRCEGIGWCGTIGERPGATTLLDAAVKAARRPWNSIRAGGGDLALAAASSKGDPQAWDSDAPPDGRRFLQSLPGHLSHRLAHELQTGIFQPCPTAAACSTGLFALLECADRIERGACARALAGAADCSLTPLLIAGFSALDVLCRERMPEVYGAGTGFAPAEGAGFVALSHVGPWRLVGGVRLGDARHPTDFQDPETLRTCLAALWQSLPDPDLIVVHGTGTRSGDAYELEVLDHGEWKHTQRLACKAVVGHSLGASGVVELALALQAPVERLWKISLGFGGHLAAVAVQRCP